MNIIDLNAMDCLYAYLTRLCRNSCIDFDATGADFGKCKDCTLYRAIHEAERTARSLRECRDMEELYRDMGDDDDA